MKTGKPMNIGKEMNSTGGSVRIVPRSGDQTGRNVQTSQPRPRPQQQIIRVRIFISSIEHVAGHERASARSVTPLVRFILHLSNPVKIPGEADRICYCRKGDIECPAKRDNCIPASSGHPSPAVKDGAAIVTDGNHFNVIFDCWIRG